MSMLHLTRTETRYQERLAANTYTAKCGRREESRTLSLRLIISVNHNYEAITNFVAQNLLNKSWTEKRQHYENFSEIKKINKINLKLNFIIFYYYIILFHCLLAEGPGELRRH